MPQLPSSYDPKTREAHWQQEWQAQGVYAFRDDLARADTFVIDTPPPTVSGVLHMGHIFSYTQADFVARFQRMKGKDVCYPMGFDDNGLPTERLVEKVKGIRASALVAEEGGREKFIQLCREVVDEAEDEFRRLFKSVALSVDWSREYQTVSPRVRALSQASFVALLEKGDIYRDFRPTYWDWVDQTAIAQAEIEDKEMDGWQCTIPFGLIAKSEWRRMLSEGAERPDFAALSMVPVMTTRPELLGACVALMCHPDDAGKYEDMLAVSPLFNVVLPICADEKVDKEKGTGFVMCCSWGDDTDKEWISKYQLAWRPHLNLDGRLKVVDDSDGLHFNAGKDGQRGKMEHVHTSFIWEKNCLNVANAREAFASLHNRKLIRDIKNENSAKGRALALLEKQGLLYPIEGQEKPYAPRKQTVKCAERSGTPIEIIPTYQWFTRVTDKKEALLEKGAACDWYPEFMKIRLNQWIEGLKEDWCISRQRFFGVPVPVWYSRREGEEGKILLPTQAQLPVDPLSDLPEGYAREEVAGDADVLDTWATSSLTPEINAQSLEPNKLFPADLRPQAHEIIRTWAFYTIVKAHLHGDCIPWRHLMISGWCLAADKTKMSKSKGNVVTPVALIEEKGADAVRYWASTSRLGADTAFSEDVLKIGRKLVTKLWNAGNFVSQQLGRADVAPATALRDVEEGRITETLDRWILTRLHRAVARATEEFERFEYADARAAIEDFFWNDWCDNYLELVKTRAYGEQGDEAGQRSAIITLHYCLHTVLRLFAPFVPHVTEELFSHLFPGQGSIHARGQWPKAEEYPLDALAEQAGIHAVAILNAIRKAKSEASVSIKFPAERVEVQVLGAADDAAQQWLQSTFADVIAAGNARVVTLVTALSASPVAANEEVAIAVELAQQDAA